MRGSTPGGAEKRPRSCCRRLYGWVDECGVADSSGRSIRDSTPRLRSGCCRRTHESLDNVTPADAYFGRKYAVVSEREKIKQRTMRKRKKEYLAAMAA